MKFVRKIDEQGFFIEDTFAVELNEYTIETPCPSGFYRPKWNGTEWVEGMAQEEIDLLKNVAVEPTVEERLQALEVMELERILGGM